MITYSILQICDIYRDELEGYYSALHNAACSSGIFYDKSINGWIVTSYSACFELAKSEILIPQKLELPWIWELFPNPDAACNIFNKQILFDHSDEFRASYVNWSRQLINSKDNSEAEVWLRETLRMVSGTGQLNIYDQLLKPYVSRTVFATLGLNDSERSQFMPWITDYADFLDGRINSSKDVVRGVHGMLAMANSLSKKYNLIKDSNDSDRQIADFVAVLTAGHESTAYLLGTLLLQGGSDYSLLDTNYRIYLLEALRFDSPIQIVGRMALHDLKVGDKTIKAGERVYLHIGAANRDPFYFDHPDQFVPGRSRQPLSFGSGERRCLGAPFALWMAESFLQILRDSSVRVDIQYGGVRRKMGVAGRSFEEYPATIEKI